MSDYEQYFVKETNMYLLPKDVLEKLFDECQNLKADYGSLAQVERDVLKEKVKELNGIIDTYKILLEANDLGEMYKKINELECKIKKYIDILTYIKHLNLYEYSLDYDYDEEMLDKYVPFNIEEIIDDFLEEVSL